MNAVVELAQQTDEWKVWRTKGIGASDTPAIMGVSPWSTPRKLWREKLGIQRSGEVFVANIAIDRGNRWEAAVRAKYEIETGLELPPVILEWAQWPVLRASLDGYNKEAGVVLEIKVAGREVFAEASSGRVHPKYYPQVQHQLLVTGAKECHFYVGQIEVDPQAGEFLARTTLAICLPNKEYQEEMLFKLKQFWNFVVTKVEPPITADDDLEVIDPETISLAKTLRQYKELQKLATTDEAILQATEEYNLARENYLEQIELHHKHNRVVCAGVLASRAKKGHWIVNFRDDVLTEPLTVGAISNEAGGSASNTIDGSVKTIMEQAL